MLRQQGDGELQLQILLLGKHLCDVSSSGLTDDALFAIFNQAAIDRLAAALAN